MEKRFGSLRFIATVFKILAWITLAFGVVSGIIVLVIGLAGGALLPQGASDMGPAMGALGGAVGGVIGGLVTVLFSLLYFLCLYAMGDAIHLALAIEQNTRETAWYLKGGDTLRQ